MFIVEIIIIVKCNSGSQFEKSDAMTWARCTARVSGDFRGMGHSVSAVVRWTKDRCISARDAIYTWFCQ